MNSVQLIRAKLQSFRRKYYTNLFIRGVSLTLAIIIGYVISAALLEYTLWLSSGVRLVLVLAFLLTWVFCLYFFLSQPLSWWLSRRGISDEQSARLIGSQDQAVRDRLVNLLQLATQTQSDLGQAGIEQKAGALVNLNFTRTIHYRQNVPYLRLLALPLLILVLLLAFNGKLLFESTSRIVRFNQQFSPQAPFQFLVTPDSLRAFRNEDFALNVRLEGESIPDNVFLVQEDKRIKLNRSGDTNFYHIFEKLREPTQFQLEAAGFYSDSYRILVAGRPELTSFLIRLDYPAYLSRRGEELKNAGNLEVPEGTRITWSLGAQDTRHARLKWGEGEEWIPFQTSDNELFTVSKVARDRAYYLIDLRNDYAGNKEPITYPVEVIKDQYPSLVVHHFNDSVLFRQIVLGGLAGDDYGISRLAIRYQVLNGANAPGDQLHTLPLPISGSAQQSFFYEWVLDSLHLEPGDRIQYHVEVWDNDGINGKKSTKSAAYVFVMPGADELRADIASSRSKTEELLDQSHQKAARLKDRLEEIQQQFKGKQTLDWQDKKMLQDLMRERDDLDKLIEDLQKQNELLKEKSEAFSEQNERLREQAEQLEKLMDQLLDEETRKLLEELEHLLKENDDPQQLQRLLDRLNKNSRNLEKELDRLKELLKKEKFEFDVQQALSELEEMTQQQEKLLEETQEAIEETKEQEGKKEAVKSDSLQNVDNQELAKEQESLNEQFNEWQKTLEDLNTQREEINSPEELPDSEQTEEVDQAQQESQEKLQQNQPGESTKPQQKAIQKMKEMQEQMSAMQNSMSMEMDMQNMESLRQILHGLITLSFSQEELMDDFNQVQLSDPRYNMLAQQQLKIQDDVKVLEDSLLALAKRDPMMEAVVTREVGDLNDHAQKALELARERRKANASSEMQLTMTSMNNLALMLNDHYDMMMDAMANAMPGKTSKKSPGKQPSMGEMQRELNERIEQLKQGGKTGRELSEELARLAAEQERIRKAFREMEENMKREGGKLPGEDLPGKMEQTEWDLVNKQITEQTIRRQREILTRLLEAEKSMREQEFDEERKGETAKEEYDKEVPRAFEEYLRLKEKEVELLRTMPPRLYPYYKKEVNEYFKRLNQGRQ